MSLISENIVRKLKLKKFENSIAISGVGESSFGRTNGEVQLVLQSIYSDQRIEVSAHSIDHLTSSLPTFSAEGMNWDYLQGLQLADPHFKTPAQIDLLISADIFGQLIKPRIVQHDSRSPVAQLTVFGWIIFGPTGPAHVTSVISHHVTQSTEQLDELLTKFWIQEEIPGKKDSNLTKEELDCEQHFRSTHSRDESGRYIVRLPLSASTSLLGDSHRIALACLKRMLSRISKDQRFFSLYSNFLKEYEELDHMREINVRSTSSAQRNRAEITCCSDEMTLAHDVSASGGWRVSEDLQADLSGSSQNYYLPHHGVLRESSETTKLRVVFNGSAKTSSGKSLNDILHTGAKTQRDISDVLLWTRQHRLIFMTDITKMFRQILVHEDDWPLQQILWKNSNGDIVTYQLKTVTYDTRSAPYLANRVLIQLAEDEGHRFPLAVSSLIEGRYVDDICGGANTSEELIETAQQVRDLCASGGMPLAKWHSNCSDLLKWLSPDSTSDDQRVYEDSETRILGLSWLPSSDHFIFSTKSAETSKISKRLILSEIAQLFNPLGFLAPVVIRGKMLLQELWIEKLDWDDEVSPQVAHCWEEFREDLVQLKNVSVPRWLGITENAQLEIHGFSDASQLAMAAVVFLKVTDEHGVRISLICSKTKVAPLKKLTIPRLELTAAVLLAKLVKYVNDQLKLANVPTYLWTDSSVTLHWISSHPSRWKEFVRNRVQLIQELSSAQWKFVPGKENPADCASRGLTAAQLASHKLWWQGPQWLRRDSSSWREFSSTPISSIDLEEKLGVILNVKVQHQEIWDLIHRYSSLNKLLRITAIRQRFIARLKRIPKSSLSYALNPADIEQARIFWIKASQSSHFSSELLTLSRGQKLSSAHPLTRLTSFIDHQGILRVGGRLKFADLKMENKHQAIIPKESRFAQLIIEEAHLRTLHGGTQLTLGHLRESYWILGGRAPVSSSILKCVPCARQRGIRAQQLMGQLPTSRLAQTRAFVNTGIDYAGPVSLRSWKGRGHKSYKGWLAIFVCMTTSAVHLEVVSDYSADGFIAAYRRFVSRRGICQNLFSDCGTNFVGADKELKKLFSMASKESHQIAQLLLKDGTRWSFNPPGALHFGGKWEAAVKSVKLHLKRTIGDSLLTFEELTTLLTQIEAVLNSRPLEPLSEDPDDVSALTPGHFLIGQALSTLPEPSLEHLNVNRLSRWQLIQQKVQCFWKRWSTSYLQHLQSISKWHHPSNEIKIGSIVLLTDERLPPSKWPLARVTALHPGKDDLTRVVTIKTANSSFKRPISKLALLPVPIKDG